MFRKEIAESYTLVVGTRFNIQPIIASIVLGEVKRSGIVVVGNERLFPPEVRDDGAVFRGAHRIYRKAIHPAVILRILACKRPLPSIIIQVQSQTRIRHNRLAVVRNTISKLIARLRDFKQVSPIRRTETMLSGGMQ